MANVCVSDDFRIEDGKLGLANVPASGAWQRIISAVYFPSGAVIGGEGMVSFGRLTSLPGKRISYAAVLVMNEYDTPLTVMVRAQRPAMNVIVSNPNAAQIRSKWSYKITDGPLADPWDASNYPDPSQDFDLQVGVSLDAGASSGGVPVRGVISRIFPAAYVEDIVPAKVLPGQYLYVWFATYLWTPPPWSDNSNNNSPQHYYGSLGQPLIDVYSVADVGMEVVS